jgi:hypothetical protein
MASRVRDLKDTNFSTLDNTKNKNIIKYDFSSGKFVIISSDQWLSISAEDNDVPNDFASVVQQEVNPNNILLKSVDGGSF